MAGNEEEAEDALHRRMETAALLESQAFRAYSDEQETSPAYKALHEAGLIASQYLVKSAEDLDLIPANSDVNTIVCRQTAACLALPVLGCLIMEVIVKYFCVKHGHVRCGISSGGMYHFFGAGAHRYVDPFLQFEKEDRPLTDTIIQHGNRAIVTIPQGFICLAFDKGQPVILPPGLHQWKSDTLKVAEMIDLSLPVIRIGPLTLLTVDEGYAAVTQDNGRQRVLPGGNAYMLTHRNWKFEKFMSLKIHTEDVGPIQATTADNVVLQTTATVNWRIEDAMRAARMASNTMMRNEQERFQRNPNANPAVRQDVLKQAVASLAAVIGTVRYSESIHVAASSAITVLSKINEEGLEENAAEEGPMLGTQSMPYLDIDTNNDDCGLASIFSVNQMTAAAQHANEICAQYGVCIISINIVSACPVDGELSKALSVGAVAAASAQQAEVAARGDAKAKLIASQAEAEALRVEARAVADAERLRAQGKQDAAAMLETNEIAVHLAKIERSSELIGSKPAYFFGDGPHSVPSLLAN